MKLNIWDMFCISSTLAVSHVQIPWIQTKYKGKKK